MEIQRDSMEVDVLVVGAGPAGLATAIHIADLVQELKSQNALSGYLTNDEFTIMVIEKGAEVGDHILSGAVLDPRGLDELIPGWLDKGAPVESKVTNESMYFMTKSGRLKVPYVPKSMDNHGYYTVSASKIVKWLGSIAEEKGVEVYTGMAGVVPIIEDGEFKGVITDDKGIDKDGNQKGNFEPGIELRAKVTVLAEGPHGSLTKQTSTELNLNEGRNPQNYVTGVKELWELPAGRIKAGTVYHTLGFPLGMNLFGGGWIYAQDEMHISLGLVTSLSYKDPRTDPHAKFQEFKQHPWVSSLLKDGKMQKYGAKTISEGGYFAMPKLYHSGLMLVGESAGFLNSMRLKGIHLGIKSGMMAAKAAVKALANEDTSESMLKHYDDLFQRSWAKNELWKVRNFHQGYENSLVGGLLHTAMQMVTGGRGFSKRLHSKPDHKYTEKLNKSQHYSEPNAHKFDGELTFDKVTDVYASGTKHEENQPCHLQITDNTICVDKCPGEFGNPCQHFCPASVYEVSIEESKTRLQVNASNCVHCKTCDIADPYGIINWVPPEGGGGPVYSGM